MTLVCILPDVSGGHHLWSHTCEQERAAAHAAGASDLNRYDRGFCQVWRLTEGQMAQALVNGATPVAWTPYGLDFANCGG